LLREAHLPDRERLAEHVVRSALARSELLRVRHTRRASVALRTRSSRSIHLFPHHRGTTQPAPGTRRPIRCC